MNKQMIKRKAAAFLGTVLLLGGCAAREVQVQIQQPNLPAAAYISRSSETEAPAPDRSENSETDEAPAPAPKETATEPVPQTEPVSQAEPAPRTEPAPKGEITLLGANMVYTGETFTYSYELNEAAEPPEIVWECGGDAGSITADGEFTAIRKGTAELTVTDRANRLRGTLTVHVVDTAAEVDFVPEVNGIPIVNKTYPLPADYDPGDLMPEAFRAFTALVSAAAEDGVEITFLSGYRSYGYQKMVHDNWIDKYDGDEAGADRVSARAGHSEHQLGLSIDVNELVLEFAEKPEGIWLKENCTKFGFIIRYPRGSEPITGYIYEPWHIRYLGEELAAKVTESGLTLEEYLGIDSYYRDPAPLRPVETTAAEGAAEPQETLKDGA